MCVDLGKVTVSVGQWRTIPRRQLDSTVTPNKPVYYYPRGAFQEVNGPLCLIARYTRGPTLLARAPHFTLVRAEENTCEAPPPPPRGTGDSREMYRGASLGRWGMAGGEWE